jgi:hypothetical protein
MSLFKRQARRVAAVGIGVGLLVLGLEAPAFAAPAVTSFTPTSGPAGCVVDITGTGFKASPAAQISVNFTSGTTIVATAATKSIISDTEIWATVPAADADFLVGAAYTIRVDDALLGTGTASTTTFLLTSAAGACAPTITSFTPTCGAAGDVVKITGTNLLAPTEVGGTVEFAPYSGSPLTGIVAANTNPDISDPTTLQVVVPGPTPTPVADGPITVKTFDTDAVTAGVQGGRVQSTTLFTTPPPDCPLVVPVARSITLSLRKHLVARGKVSASSATAPAGCTAAVPVKIQRRVSGHWKNVGSTTTSDTGAYKKRIKDRPGKYRAKAPKVTLTSGEICSGATSPVRRNT